MNTLEKMMSDLQKKWVASKTDRRNTIYINVCSSFYNDSDIANQTDYIQRETGSRKSDFDLFSQSTAD